MLAKAILAHGDIGYKFCWLLPFEDQNQGTPIGNESNGAAAGDGATLQWYHFSRVLKIFTTSLVTFFFFLLTLFICLFSFVHILV